MVILLRILLAVYVVAINLYSFLLVRAQKLQTERNQECNKISDGKILFSGALGGALGAYSALFILKYKRDDIALMVILPLFIALSVYLVVIGVITDFGIN